jgi:hypothetical protein
MVPMFILDLFCIACLQLICKATYIDPMNTLVCDIVENTKFVHKTKAEVDQMLEAASKADPSRIPYFLHNFDKPGTDNENTDGTATLIGNVLFTISWKYKKQKFRDFISVTPDGLSFEKGMYFQNDKPFRNSQELIQWFKMHSMDINTRWLPWKQHQMAAMEGSTYKVRPGEHDTNSVRNWMSQGGNAWGPGPSSQGVFSTSLGQRS